MKKLISLAMIVILCGSFTINSFAYANINGESYNFKNHDGSVIEYYLDENLFPYHYINGEKVYIALPLDHLKVTNPELITYLNSQIPNTRESISMRSAPTNYVDISAIMTNGNSLAFGMHVNDLRVASVKTSIMKFNQSHEALRIKTTNLVKAHIWNMSKIAFTYYCYSQYTDEWFSPYSGTHDCTVADGFGMQHAPDMNPYAYLLIEQDSGIISFDLTIWSTYAW